MLLYSLSNVWRESHTNFFFSKGTILHLQTLVCDVNWFYFIPNHASTICFIASWTFPSKSLLQFVPFLKSRVFRFMKLEGLEICYKSFKNIFNQCLHFGSEFCVDRKGVNMKFLWKSIFDLLTQFCNKVLMLKVISSYKLMKINWFLVFTNPPFYTAADNFSNFSV